MSLRMPRLTGLFVLLSGGRRDPCLGQHSRSERQPEGRLRGAGAAKAESRERHWPRPQGRPVTTAGEASTQSSLTAWPSLSPQGHSNVTA